MSLRVGAVQGRAELERVFRFRYRVYVEELKMTDLADHGRKWLVDDLDEHSLSYAVFDGDDVLHRCEGSLPSTQMTWMPAPGSRPPIPTTRGSKEPEIGGKVALNLARELAGRLASQNPPDGGDGAS